ncbi:MAG: hypothetical protein ACE1ZQ_03795, partial [Ignavibacteriaceae bacterium]
GAVQRLNIKITTRGHSRLESCNFPPLRLIFDPEKSRSTVFEGQRRVKMVTQCKSGCSKRSGDSILWFNG